MGMSAPITPVSKSSCLSYREDGKVPSVLKESNSIRLDSSMPGSGCSNSQYHPKRPGRTRLDLAQGADHLRVLLLVVLRFLSPCSVSSMVDFLYLPVRHT